MHKKNGGLSSARNTGLDIAKGKYISFIDSDDYIDNRYIEILYRDIFNNKAEISICENIMFKKYVEKIPESFIEVPAPKKENSPFIVIVVLNSCRTAPAYDSDHLPISNKENTTKHGYGIKSIKKVTKKHGGNLQMYYDDSSSTFHTIITLKS